MSLQLSFNPSTTFDVDQCLSLSDASDKLIADIISAGRVSVAGTTLLLSVWLSDNTQRKFTLKNSDGDLIFKRENNEAEIHPGVLGEIIGVDPPRCNVPLEPIVAEICDESEPAVTSLVDLDLEFPSELVPVFIETPKDLTGIDSLCVLQACEPFICKESQILMSPDDPSISQYFGRSVAVFGNRAAVSQPTAMGGFVHLFELDSTTGCWVFSTTINSPANISSFGEQVTLSGDVVVVTGVNQDPPTDLTAFIYEKNEMGFWTQVATARQVAEKLQENPTIVTAGEWIIFVSGLPFDPPVPPNKIQILMRVSPSNWAGAQEINLGSLEASSVSFDGTTLAVSVTDSVRLYTLQPMPDGWTISQIINSPNSGTLVTGVAGNQLVIGAPANGTVSTFRYIGTTWLQTQQFSSADFGLPAVPNFGSAIAISESGKAFIATGSNGELISFYLDSIGVWKFDKRIPNATLSVPNMQVLFQTIDISGSFAFAGFPSVVEMIAGLANVYCVNPISTNSGCVVIDLPCGNFNLTCTDNLIIEDTGCQKYERTFVAESSCGNSTSVQQIDVNKDITVTPLEDRCNIESLDADAALQLAADTDALFLRTHVFLGCAPDSPINASFVIAGFFDVVECSRCCRNERSITRTWTVQVTLQPLPNLDPCVYQKTIVQSLSVVNPRWSHYFPACTCPCPTPVVSEENF